MKLTKAIVWLLAIFSGHACAISLGDYRSGAENEDINDFSGVYITGVGAGYYWANAMLTASKQRPVYCQPDNIPLNGFNYEEMVKRESARGKYTDSTPVAVILLRGLMTAFPCQQ